MKSIKNIIEDRGLIVALIEFLAFRAKGHRFQSDGINLNVSNGSKLSLEDRQIIQMEKRNFIDFVLFFDDKRNIRSSIMFWTDMYFAIEGKDFFDYRDYIEKYYPNLWDNRVKQLQRMDKYLGSNKEWLSLWELYFENEGKMYRHFKNDEKTLSVKVNNKHYLMTK